VEKGNLVYTGEKFSALDSVGKNPNRWHKIGMMHCKICRKSCLSRHV